MGRYWSYTGEGEVEVAWPLCTHFSHSRLVESNCSSNHALLLPFLELEVQEEAPEDDIMQALALKFQEEKAGSSRIYPDVAESEGSQFMPYVEHSAAWEDLPYWIHKKASLDSLSPPSSIKWLMIDNNKK
ncbi:hypothetical protein Vadar_019925 [Vaccinium darrowii]|uniref:Uncharacterized protein n=1 Tax=Vaccinium darrowii TaxID=229202 RepID=A0ACB7Z5V2_9ERIC|nr:hypothetical protein Vadar_019925 [Vaccinium darrowii]